MKNEELLNKIVIELISEDAIPIVNYLKGKKKISEFVISEELELEIHKTRFLLYKLLDHNIVSFIRKKDKIKGWYICYWDLNEDIVNHLDVKMKQDKLDKLYERLDRESGNQFYMCRNVCARMDFDKSMEFNFKCPECGEIMHLQDNARTIEFIKERINELETDPALQRHKKLADERKSFKDVELMQEQAAIAAMKEQEEKELKEKNTAAAKVAKQEQIANAKLAKDAKAAKASKTKTPSKKNDKPTSKAKSKKK